MLNYVHLMLSLALLQTLASFSDTVRPTLLLNVQGDGGRAQVPTGMVQSAMAGSRAWFPGKELHWATLTARGVCLYGASLHSKH